ncbi:GTPase IMAP family member 4-like isoform X2 [Hemibagrus wyckioides]|uniref:GTPase IMAP family member 4-like isoform X2 n=1 Tax=Hemibagrus wyckioides TaxID=337641 RepID=UPI00266D6A92|nr:GTPase IMAP family member 4-like isoform X2 [Hemibagrus wyckioides]
MVGKHEREQETPSGRRSPDGDRPNMSMQKIVQMGKTGCGKSTSGNSIMPSCSEAHQDSVEDRNMCVSDTPGLFDTSVDPVETDLEIEI